MVYREERGDGGGVVGGEVIGSGLGGEVGGALAFECCCRHGIMGEWRIGDGKDAGDGSIEDDDGSYFKARDNLRVKWRLSTLGKANFGSIRGSMGWNIVCSLRRTTSIHNE